MSISSRQCSAFESGDARRIDCVLKAAAKQDPLARAVASALGWLSLETAQPMIERLAIQSDARMRYIAVAAAAIHRFDLGRRLEKALKDEDPQVRARGLRAVAELGRLDLVAFASDQLHSDNQACRAAAACTMARFSGSTGRLDAALEAELCQSVVDASNNFYRCLQLLMHRTEPKLAGEFIRRWFSDPKTKRAAITASGLLGDPALVPWLLDQFKSPPLARLAGEALTMITGLAIEQRPYEGEWPEGFSAGPNEDPNDDNVAFDPDENLPWPNRPIIADWWTKRRDGFAPGTRYLRGRPLDDEKWLAEVLRNGYQRQLQLPQPWNSRSVAPANHCLRFGLQDFANSSNWELGGEHKGNWHVDTIISAELCSQDLRKL